MEIFNRVNKLIESRELNKLASSISGFYERFLRNLGSLIGDNLEELLKSTFMVRDVGELISPQAGEARIRVTSPNAGPIFEVTLNKNDEVRLRVFKEALEYLKGSFKM